MLFSSLQVEKWLRRTVCFVRIEDIIPQEKAVGFHEHSVDKIVSMILSFQSWTIFAHYTLIKKVTVKEPPWEAKIGKIWRSFSQVITTKFHCNYYCKNIYYNTFRSDFNIKIKLSLNMLRNKSVMQRNKMQCRA